MSDVLLLLLSEQSDLLCDNRNLPIKSLERTTKHIKIMTYGS